MHMADALLTPAVGGGMWAASAGTIALCSARLRREADDRKAPVMGVLGAFLFAAQMINFSLPGTGSSGHLGGGVLLAILLGPSAAFLTVASVLVVQALFFADGGLLALGCNIFNLGFLPAFVAFPLVYRTLIGTNPGRGRLTAVTMLCAVVALQLGALAVVAETVASGISALPLSSFLLVMQPVHLAIGVVEGAVTAAVVLYVERSFPGILPGPGHYGRLPARPVRQMVSAFVLAALVTGGVVSAFASKDPDGLEWAIARVTGSSHLKAPPHPVHRALALLQERMALLPGYDFAARPGQAAPAPGTPQQGIRPGTSLSGVLGALAALLLALVSGALLKKRKGHRLYGSD